eukprot:4764056-Pyramimonas_sp.AAC.1
MPALTPAWRESFMTQATDGIRAGTIGTLGFLLQAGFQAEQFPFVPLAGFDVRHIACMMHWLPVRVARGPEARGRDRLHPGVVGELRGVEFRLP